MPIYDYQCSNMKCNKIREEYHGMLEMPVIVCMKCGNECIKLVGTSCNVFAATVPLYDFVDNKTTIKPVRIKSKRQWQEHLKRIGQVEASNEAPSRASIESTERTKKMVAKRELKDAIVKSVKDKKHIREVKQKYASKIR